VAEETSHNHEDVAEGTIHDRGCDHPRQVSTDFESAPPPEDRVSRATGAVNSGL